MRILVRLIYFKWTSQSSLVKKIPNRVAPKMYVLITVEKRTLGSFSFQETLRYLDFLQFEYIPTLAVLIPNPQHLDVPYKVICSLQDTWAPPYLVIGVRQFLAFTQFSDRQGHRI